MTQKKINATSAVVTPSISPHHISGRQFQERGCVEGVCERSIQGLCAHEIGVWNNRGWISNFQTCVSSPARSTDWMLTSDRAVWNDARGSSTICHSNRFTGGNEYGAGSTLIASVRAPSFRVCSNRSAMMIRVG